MRRKGVIIGKLRGVYLRNVFRGLRGEEGSEGIDTGSVKEGGDLSPAEAGCEAAGLERNPRLALGANIFCPLTRAGSKGGG